MNQPKDAFARLELFKSSDFTLFGNDQQPVSLAELAEVGRQEKETIRRISSLTRKNAGRQSLEIIRFFASLIGISGLFAIVPWLYPIFYTLSGGEWAVWVFVSLLIDGISIGLRSDYRKAVGGDLLLTESTGYFLDKSSIARKKNLAEKEALQARLKVWERIPETIRGDVRRLTECIASYDANIRLFNAESKRAAFYIERGHYRREEVEGGLLAMRGAINAQEREIVETIATTDKACITLVLQPDDKQVAITPNLESLRAKLDGLSTKVGEQLALERIMQTELANPDDTTHRLKATSQAVKTIT